MRNIIYNFDGIVTITGEDDQLTQQDYENAVQNLLDTTAQSRGYENIVSACSYAGYQNVFQNECIQLGIWRSGCWAMCYSILKEVEGGTRVAPSIEELLDVLGSITL